jgi:glycosyltransferase involved in cell wall biosynthesis
LHLHVGGNITKRVMALAFFCSLFGKGRKILSFHSGGYPSTIEGKAAKRNSLRGHVFRRFERVIAVNPTIVEVFARYGLDPEKVDVIYPFVHRTPDPRVEIPPELRAFADKHKPFLLTVGLLEPEYDLLMQIDAIEKVLRTSPAVGLMIVGSGSLQSALRDSIDSKTYKENIFLAGDVEHGVTLHLINQCDALLRTTLFDGDAISVREALFLETPVIATDNGMRPKGVQTIPIHDENALIEQMKRLRKRWREKKSDKERDYSNIDAVLGLYDGLSKPSA